MTNDLCFFFFRFLHKISPVPSEEYGNRFFDFMKAVMRGGGGGARFKAE